MSPAQEEQEKASTSILKERRFKLSRACDRCRLVSPPIHHVRLKNQESEHILISQSSCSSSACRRTATLEDRMHQLETLIQAIPPAVFAAGGAGASALTSSHLLSSDNIASPLASFASANHNFPAGVPPPSLHVFPLTNPSTHFRASPSMSSPRAQSPNTAFSSMLGQSSHTPNASNSEQPEEISRMSISASYLYFDDEGYTRWQGETSGLPLLDLLVENHTLVKSEADKGSPDPTWANPSSHTWFPNRTPRRTDVNPETLWRLITSYIVPELMDSLVQCYLCTSYYLLPFLHVPTFLADYGNPRKWGEPGFAAFIVAICCLASRHIDDPRVRSDPSDGISAGTQWFELFGRLRTLPIADHPTLYTIQADLIAAVYAVGLGKLSKAAALLSEAITVSIDTGLHRSADTYDIFNPIEDEVRKRTFWCVYLWDKQLSAHFGRPPMIRLRDTDIGEPIVVDDEFITHDGVLSQPAGTESRMSAFIASVRIMVVMESVLDIPPPRDRTGDSSTDLREEEALLDEIRRSIPPYWAHTSATLASDDVIRVTQAVRLHCAEQYVRMLIHRHRFSNFVAERAYSASMEEDLVDVEKEEMSAAQSCALQIISSHMQVAGKGLMTYYGVHVIHQLTQAGRTLITILINCKSEKLQRLIQPALDALRSCVGLLRRFSGRYVCGQRSGDLMEEFCRLTQIPLEPSHPEGQEQSSSRPPWIRPIRKKTPSVAAKGAGSDGGSQHSSPEAFSPSEFFIDPTLGATSPQTIPQSAFSPAPVSSSSRYPRRLSLSAPSFMDAGGMDMDASAGMYLSSPADMMNMFGDGSVDVAALFSGASDFNMGQQLSEPHEPLYGHMNGGNLIASP
ncbi:fungal-specific transcription factor domain-containing protein [Suillus placidus]|uniref:Fungal-specific transcription factor domain-containing protein n=1 Tax=Suillus placidus TaxID=48579 RepID=A0A9P7A1D9_9AGAM|nr:fungal-specific transcription factor domain-containing protein [Suillus placidus]